MNILEPSRRRLYLGLAAGLALGVLAVGIVAAVILWRFTEWGADAVDHLTKTAAAIVAPVREDAQRAVEDSRATVAGSVAAVTLAQETGRRAIENAANSVADATERTAQALVEPESVARHLTEAAAQDASRAIAAAVASVAPVASGAMESLPALLPRAVRHPTAWPEHLGLQQLRHRRFGDVAEYVYVAAVPPFELEALRDHLVAHGYAEQVLAQGEGMLEAIYRGEDQLHLSSTTRGKEQRIAIREMPAVVTNEAAP